MAIEFVCPACQGSLRVADDVAGCVVRCGSCMTTLRVPDPHAAEPEPTVEPIPRAQDARPVEPDSRGDRDEHGEPRRRRSTSTKTGGRSFLFWLVIIVLVLGLFTCLACGGIMTILATPHWQQHDSPEGKFAVELPAPLNKDIESEVRRQIKRPLKPKESVEGTMLVGRLETYWVLYKEIDPNDRGGASDEQLLKLTIENHLKDSSATLFRETPKVVDTYPAREVVLSHVDGSTQHCLFVIAKTRIYIVAAGGPFVSSAGNNRIRRFLDSFHVKGNPWRGGDPKPE